jgi:hypothetical protein
METARMASPILSKGMENMSRKQQVKATLQCEHSTPSSCNWSGHAREVASQCAKDTLFCCVACTSVYSVHRNEDYQMCCLLTKLHPDILIRRRSNHIIRQQFCVPGLTI